ncbi:TraR/DksA family transcriptional regulator [Polaromonas hydrogenivorans]|uniref:TraR/DksA family transcriptional regulator n=1 Tax=Polaromonas hydrogenivorans TaxID=335476 RepID=A0AAU7LNW6_9BURK
MTPQQATPYRQQLLEMRTALLAQMSEQRGGTLGRAQAAAEHFERREDSSAQVATERELEFAIGERETNELAMIDAALARIETGNYGECIDCGTDIAAQRLQASPEVSRCISCQVKAEQHRSA